MPEIAQTKAVLRRQMRAWLRQLSIDERQDRSAQILSQLAEMDSLRQGGLMVYAAMPTEPDLDGLWEQGLDLIFPQVVLETRELHLFRPKSPDDLARGCMGIREPIPHRCQRVTLEEVSNILVPSLAYDRDDNIRLGQGGGFYDRLLPKFRGHTLGICYEEQRIPGIPRAAHDCGVAQVVTEVGVYPS